MLRQRVRNLVLLALLVGYGGQSPPAQALVTQVVRASGTGLIVGQDLANAFEQAKNAALREAVEEAAGTLVAASTQVQSFAAVQDEIFLQTAGFVRKFTLVSKGTVDAHTFQVTLDAEVDLGQLHRQLDAMNLLIEQVGNPPILCRGREFLADTPNVDLEWGVVAEALEKDMKTASPRFSLVSSQNRRWDEASALAEARKQGAEILVTASSAVRSLPSAKIPGGTDLKQLGIVSAAAEVELRLQWVDTGAVVAVLNKKTRAAEANFEAAARKASRSGVDQLAPELIKKLLADWQEKVYSGRQLELKVRATPSQLQRFERDFATQLGGLDQLRSRGYQAGLARYEVRSRNEGYQVARELSAKGMGTLNVEILQVTGNTLELKLSD